MFPPLPSWDGLHPLIIHFPIALLIVAPLLVFIGIFAPRKPGFLVSAFVLMLAGTIATWIAVSTGSAAGELAERIGGVGTVLEDHEGLAETTRNVFTALTAVFVVLLLVPRFFRREADHGTALIANSSGRRQRIFGLSRAQKIMTPMLLVFLLVYSGGLVLLANTAHAGGRLVHEFGVRAVMGPATQDVSKTPARKADDDD